MTNTLMLKAIEHILDEVTEGIHVVDSEGITLIYNDAMGIIEGLMPDQVIGKHLLDVFPNWTKENSTLLMALEHGKPIVNTMQSYLNLEGRMIRTTNTTYPIFSGEDLIGAVEVAQNLTEVSQMSDEIMELRQKLLEPKKQKKLVGNQYRFEDMVGRSEPFLKALKIANRAAQTSSSVLIVGETGTGKELFAQSVHSASDRMGQPFIAQNCAALPESLLESILFGTTKGSFTGAQDRPGLFEQAHGGTLFLDEINSMSMPLQAKLLRVLQEGYVRRLGGQKDVMIDVRIIAASNESPLKLIEENAFRKDLYYRLNVISLVVPPLQKREGDIPLLIDHFIRLYNGKLGRDIWMLSQEIQDVFALYSWPGNVRELQNFLESAMNMVTDEHVITWEHIPDHVRELLMERPKKTEGVDVLAIDDLNDHLDSLERRIIEAHFKWCEGNVSKTAKRLQISRQNLQYKLKKYNLI